MSKAGVILSLILIATAMGVIHVTVAPVSYQVPDQYLRLQPDVHAAAEMHKFQGDPQALRRQMAQAAGLPPDLEDKIGQLKEIQAEVEKAREAAEAQKRVEAMANIRYARAFDLYERRRYEDVIKLLDDPIFRSSLLRPAAETLKAKAKRALQRQVEEQAAARPGDAPAPAGAKPPPKD
jgi:hypothetical protein